MYAAFEQDTPLSQGDVINNVVLTYIPDISDPSFVVGDDVVQRDLTQPFDSQEDLIVLGQAIKSPVLILTQSCDIDNREYICVARIFPLNDSAYNQINSPKKKAEHIRRHYQQAGVRPTIYYLREVPEQNFPKSLASFLELHTVRKTENNLSYLKQNRILRLNPEAVEDLQFRIGYFFGRFAATNDDYMLTDEERNLVRGESINKPST